MSNASSIVTENEADTLAVEIKNITLSDMFFCIKRETWGLMKTKKKLYVRKRLIAVPFSSRL